MYRLFFLSMFSSLFLFIGCESEQNSISRKAETRFEQIETRFIADNALDVFSADLKLDQGWILSGETTDTLAARAINRFADSLLGKGNYQTNFILLPYKSLGDSTYALVKRSVAHLRREPRHASEMLDQVILGNELRLLKRQNSWYLVQNHYGYIGWITKYSIQRLDKKSLVEWGKKNFVCVNQLSGFVYTKPDKNSQKLSDLVLNATLPVIEERWSWTQVVLPDGREGYVDNKLIEPWNTEIPSRKKLVENILTTAYSMIGIPYLWGGKSSKANDCSGFTQTVFRTNGIQLARDARQQALQGQEIISDSTFSNVQPGDLLFFGSGERITHVGISLGGYNFIHQDRDVHIDSFHPDAENFNAFRKKTLKKIKRIIE